LDSIGALDWLTDPLSNVFTTLDGQNIDLYVSNERTLSIFEGMTISDCENYHLAVDMVAKDYLSSCKNFEENPSELNWKRYIETYAPLYSSLWLSYFWRMYIKKISSSVASSLGMSSFHYNEILQLYQEKMTSLEEDFNLHQRIVQLAEEMRPLVLSDRETKEFECSGKLY
jgi:hypothetical protein